MSGAVGVNTAVWSQHIRKLGPLFSVAGPWMLPARLAVGALASAVTGAGLGVLAEYGAYYYAYSYGIRPPLEGIPYLRLAVTGLTVAILFGAAFAFGLVYGFAQLLLFAIHQFLKQASPANNIALFFPDHLREMVTELTFDGFVGFFRRAPFKYVAALALLFGIGMASVAAITAAYSGRSWRIEGLSTGLMGVVAVLLLWRQRIALWLALGAVSIVIIGGPLLVFNVHYYGEVLRKLGYGGGVIVTVVLTASETDAKVQAQSRPAEKIQGPLLLRTNEALIVFDNVEKLIREIPLSRVQYIDTGLGPAHLRLIEGLMQRAAQP